MGERTPEFLGTAMAKQVKIFRSFEEQEMYFLQYFYTLSPKDRFRRLCELQKKMYPGFLNPAAKKITIYKAGKNGF